jgi:hypothetical protein
LRHQILPFTGLACEGPREPRTVERREAKSTSEVNRPRPVSTPDGAPLIDKLSRVKKIASARKPAQ